LHVGDKFNGEDVEVVLFESFLLPASSVEILAEISFLIKQADAYKRQTQVAGSFEVIAGKDAESTGEDGETFRDSEFEGKVGDKEIALVDMFAVVPGALAVEIGIEMLGNAVEVGEARIILSSGFEHRLIDGTEHADGIVTGGLPKLAVEATEKVDSSMVPTPAEVVGDREERLERVGERRTNFVGSNGFHEDLEGSESRRLWRIIDPER
jgi:hypothetical protein